jgi:hypothetical protein
VNDTDIDTDTCPRCGSGFHCGVRDAAPCACTTIALGLELRAELRARYTRCVCVNCLAELAGREKSRPVSRPAGSEGTPQNDLKQKWLCHFA